MVLYPHPVLYLFWIHWHISFQQAINFLQTRRYNICAIINKHSAWYCNCATREGSKRNSWWISCNADLVADDILTYVTVNRAVVHLQMQIAANYRCGHWCIHIFLYFNQTKQPRNGVSSLWERYGRPLSSRALEGCPVSWRGQRPTKPMQGKEETISLPYDGDGSLS